MGTERKRGCCMDSCGREQPREVPSATEAGCCGSQCAGAFNLGNQIIRFFYRFITTLQVILFCWMFVFL